MNDSGDPREVIGPRIRMLLPTLTPLEARVAEVMLGDATLDHATPLRTVAEAAGVSEAMVVKVSKKLGFSGFRDFRAGLIGYRSLPSARLYSEIAPGDDLAAITAKVFRTAMQALQETLAILDLAAMERAADLIHGAGQLDFYGVGGSAQIARDVAHKFLRIGRRAAVFDDAHMMLMSSALLGPQDVAVAFSHSGASAAVLEPVERARAAGARTIAITNYPGSPLARLADVVLCSTAQGSPLLGENAAARIAQLSILDAIFVAVAERDAPAAGQSLSRTMAAVQGKRKR